MNFGLKKIERRENLFRGERENTSDSNLILIYKLTLIVISLKVFPFFRPNEA
jgi:hypothetical protein